MQILEVLKSAIPTSEELKTNVRNWFQANAKFWGISVFMHLLIFVILGVAIGAPHAKKLLQEVVFFDTEVDQAVEETPITHFDVGETPIEPTVLNTESLTEPPAATIEQDAQFNDNSAVFEEAGGGTAASGPSFGGLGGFDVSAFVLDLPCAAPVASEPESATATRVVVAVPVRALVAAAQDLDKRCWRAVVARRIRNGQSPRQPIGWLDIKQPMEAGGARHLRSSARIPRARCTHTSPLIIRWPPQRSACCRSLPPVRRTKPEVRTKRSFAKACFGWHRIKIRPVDWAAAACTNMDWRPSQFAKRTASAKIQN